MKDDLEFDSIACHFFAQGEIEVLDAVSPDQRALSFFNCWTRKEAVIKARGDGLTFPLNQFEVSHRPEDPVVILGFLGKNEESEQWSLTSLDVDEGCVGALALKSEDILFNIIIGSSKKKQIWLSNH